MRGARGGTRRNADEPTWVDGPDAFDASAIIEVERDGQIRRRGSGASAEWRDVSKPLVTAGKSGGG